MSTVTRKHLEAAGRIIGENSTCTTGCGRVLYKEAQESIAQALADLEAATEARVRVECLADGYYAAAIPNLLIKAWDEGYSTGASDALNSVVGVRRNPYLPATKEETP